MVTKTSATAPTTSADPQGTSVPLDAAGTEHRGVTVLMADIVSSTDRMEALGAEGFAKLLQRFHTICTGVVRRQGGIVAQYQGDGIICYFGFPRAAEDDAARAVAAALEIVGAFENSMDDDTSVQVRTGLSSGTVMLRTDGDKFGSSAVGTCINRAARLEAMAEANTVLICDDTCRLIGRMFQLRDLGNHKLRGFRTPQSIYQVLRARTGLTTRFDALRGHLSGDLVGRTAELAQLQKLFEEAGLDGGRAVVVSADAGFGKSRLVQAFLQSAATEGAPTFILQCSPEQTGTALYPVVRYLEWVAGVATGDDDATRHAKLRRLVTQVWALGASETDILLDLISPVGADNPVDGAESVVLRRGRALQLLADRIFASVDGRGTFMVVFEDAHWLDPTSAQLVDILIARAKSHPALIMLTTRDEPPFGNGLPDATLLRLAPLSEKDARLLAQQILGEDAPVDLIIQRSEGVPLFLQEYAEMMRGEGNAGSDARQVPLSLAAIVQSKLDRLDDATRSLVRAGSALGRSFDPIFVAQIAQKDAEQADAMAQELISLNLAYPSDGTQGMGQVTFNHALVRDAVYSSMPSDEKRATHDAIAEAYLFMGAVMPIEDHVLADHLAKAGRCEEAIERYLAAAMTAAGKGAAGEALAHLEDGLHCVETFAAGQTRDLLELRLLAIQGPTLMVTRGPGNPDFGATQARAMELVEGLDMLEDMLPVVFYTAEHAWAVADLDRAEIMAEAVLMIDRQNPSDVAHMAGNMLKGMVAWHRGDNTLTAESLGRVIARHDVDKHKALYAHFIKEFGVFSHFYAGLARTIQGEFDEGRALAEGAIALSNQLNFPHERGFALLARFNTALLRDDVETADQASQEALDFSIQQGFPEFVAMAQFVQGWCLARRGDIVGGVALMQDGFGAWQQTGFTCWQALFAAIIAPYQVQIGSINEATELIERYIAQVDATGEEQTRAPLLLARAIIQRETGQNAAALQTVTAARSVARKQGASLWLHWIDAQFPVDE